MNKPAFVGALALAGSIGFAGASLTDAPATPPEPDLAPSAAPVAPVLGPTLPVPPPPPRVSAAKATAEEEKRRAAGEARQNELQQALEAQNAESALAKKERRPPRMVSLEKDSVEWRRELRAKVGSQP